MHKIEQNVTERRHIVVAIQLFCPTQRPEVYAPADGRASVAQWRCHSLSSAKELSLRRGMYQRVRTERELTLACATQPPLPCSLYWLWWFVSLIK